MVHEQLNSADLLSALVPFFLPVAGPIIGLPSSYVGTAVDVMISNLKEEKPSPGEILEATIVAAKVMVETKRMLQTPRGNNPSIK